MRWFHIFKRLMGRPAALWSPSGHRPARLWLEQLEDRLAPTGNLAITNAHVVNANNQAQNPDIGEEVYIQADFTTQDLPASASYVVSYTVDGVTLSTGALTWGAGVSGTGFWDAVWGGWFAAPIR
jgi:hypothetical protein